MMPKGAGAVDLYVPGSYTTIQSAIDAAVTGDTVWVADGTWTGTGNKDLTWSGKKITVRSENGANNCIIDCQGSGRGFYLEGAGDCGTISGFSIRNGNAGWGTGVYCENSSPTITNCTISGNSASGGEGGGIRCTYYSSPTITNCTISDNTAYWGGGIFCNNNSFPTITNCTISGNTASNGGGIFCWNNSSFTIINCTISGNTAHRGGGIFCKDNSSSTITNCTISGNTASDGGGIICSNSFPTITNCIISDNTASNCGGGIYSYYYFSPTITNCIISGNNASHGGGIHCDYYSSPTITNCTISDNAASTNGGGIYCTYYSSPTITNCIISDNTARLGGGIYCSSSPTITYCDFWNNSPEDYFGISNQTGINGNISADPQFIGGDDYHFQPISPCIDVGSNTAPAISSTDKDGNPRIVRIVDMGAYEFQSTPTPIRVTVYDAGNNFIGTTPTIQAGIDICSNGGTVLVSDWTWTGTWNKNLTWSGKKITVRSVNGSQNCIIDIQGSGVGFYLTGDCGTISGFTIRNGNADMGGGIFCSNNSSPTITNCIISGNAARYFGGGIFCYNSSPTITNCTISDNTAHQGGGIFCDYNSSPFITNNIISNNTNYGIYERYTTNSDPLTNYNCFYNNTPYNYFDEGSTNINDVNTIAGNSNNILGNPQFIGANDYHLQAISPCIDVGSNTAPGLPSTDKDGKPRIINGTVDIGAYEFGTPTYISVIPTAGTVGTIIMVSGGGFGATESVRIDFGTTRTICTTYTLALGSFTTAFTVDMQSYGSTTVRATGLNSGKTADAVFRILPCIVAITPRSGTVGTGVTVWGNGYGASETVIIHFGTIPSITAVMTSVAGNFVATFNVTTQPYGTTTIAAFGCNSGAAAYNIFRILPNIIFVTPSMGTVGSIVTVAGNGFGAMESVLIDFGTKANIQQTSSTAYGSFSACFTINTQPYGRTTIVVRGLNSGARGYANFNILPNIILVSPYRGSVGTVVTVAGNGFGVTELVMIQFGNTPTITTGSTTGTGAFEIVFTVNNQPIGTTTIIAYSVMTATNAMAYFVIRTSTILKITPATKNVPVGATFTCQVGIENVQQLATAGVYLTFNSAVLEVVKIGTGTFPPGGAVMANTYTVTGSGTGQINYSVGLYPYPASATGSGVLCTIEFRAKADGTSSVVFDFDTQHNRNTILINIQDQTIPFTIQEALYQVFGTIEIEPKNWRMRADETNVYRCYIVCGSSSVEVTGSTTFTSNGGGSWTTNTFLAKYIGTYTIQGEYLGGIGTTAVFIFPGTPTTLSYVSGSGQVGTCAESLKNPFIAKVTDKYNNPCPNVGVNWQISSFPSGATGHSLSSTNTTTNIYGTAASLLTLGTEPPGTYIIHALSTGLSGSPQTFTAQSLRRFGNIAGFCLLDLGTETSAVTTTTDIQVRIIELGTTTMTNANSYFIFQNIPVGTYTLTFDTWGASPATKTNVCISPTQVENTTNIGTMTLLAGDVNNDTQVNIGDWPGFVDAFGDYEGNSAPWSNWPVHREGDFNHDTDVNEWDFTVYSRNFGQIQPQRSSVPKPAPGSAKIKAKRTTSGELKLSFNLKPAEGVNLDDLRIGDILELEINISKAENYLGGEIHLSFNPQVLRVVDANTGIDGIQIQPGDFPQLEGPLSAVLKNEVDNSAGKIDYAVVVGTPETGNGGLFATVKFMVIACGNSSQIGFDFDEVENRETMFVEKAPTQEIGQVVGDVESPEDLIIKVPLVFTNFDSTSVYPNPVRKGQTAKFGNVPNNAYIKLRIFNIAGELVYEAEPLSASNTIEWNLKNKDNEYVASGIYIYLLEWQGLTKKGKIGVIK